MKISILCSSIDHPIYPVLESWAEQHAGVHNVRILNKRADLDRGDLLFLISCSEIVPQTDRDKFSKVLVIHASDLPEGRGWSPHVWQIIEGARSLTVTLLEAEDAVDTGAIWQKSTIDIPENALWNEINERLIAAEIALMNFAVSNFNTVVPVVQEAGKQGRYYRKRLPEDSKVSIEDSIKSQFDLIRVCDPVRYPAFIEIRGRKFKIILEEM